MTGCWGEFCTDWKQRETYEWYEWSMRQTAWPPLIEADCGKHCAAFSWLHPSSPFAPFSWWGFKSGIMQIFDANPETWSLMQCMAVTDAFTSTRACCACDDGGNCPWWGFDQRGHNPGGYCAFDAEGKCTDDNCRALAAGCGVSLFDLAGQDNGRDGSQFFGRPGFTDWGAQGCNEWDVANGNCGVCRTPMWCDDNQTSLGNWGSITTPQQWVDEFFDRDGGNHYGVRQCRYKPSQKDLFAQTMRLRFVNRQQLDYDWRGLHHDHANVWNEVNMYVDEADYTRAELLYKNLLGLVFVRTSGESPKQWDEIRALRDHWRSLGKEVPLFAINAEETEAVKIWTPETLVNLMDPVYDIQLVVD